MLPTKALCTLRQGLWKVTGSRGTTGDLLLRGGAWLEEARSSQKQEGWISFPCTFLLSLLPTCHDMSSFLPPRPSHHDLLDLDPVEHGLKP